MALGNQFRVSVLLPPLPVYLSCWNSFNNIRVSLKLETSDHCEQGLTACERTRPWSDASGGEERVGTARGWHSNRNCTSKLSGRWCCSGYWTQLRSWGRRNSQDRRLYERCGRFLMERTTRPLAWLNLLGSCRLTRAAYAMTYGCHQKRLALQTMNYRCQLSSSASRAVGVDRLTLDHRHATQVRCIWASSCLWRVSAIAARLLHRSCEHYWTWSWSCDRLSVIEALDRADWIAERLIDCLHWSFRHCLAPPGLLQVALWLPSIQLEAKKIWAWS